MLWAFKSFPVFWHNSVATGHSSSMCLTDKVSLQTDVTFCEYLMFYDLRPLRSLSCESFSPFRVRNSCGLSKEQQQQEQRYPFLKVVCAAFPCVQTMVYVCQCLGFLTCARMLMHAIAHWGRMNIIREYICTESWPCEKNPLPHQGFEPASVLRLAFLSQNSTIWAVDAAPRNLLNPLTPSLPSSHLKTTNKSAKFGTLSFYLCVFFLSFSLHCRVKGIS